jgi:hypothetical protein
MQHALIYPGTRKRVDRVAPQPEGADLLHISTTDANVHGLSLPVAPDVNGTRQPAVIIAHGSGDVIDYSISALHGFQERGVGMLLVEYPSYGRSTDRLPSDRYGPP